MAEAEGSFKGLLCRHGLGSTDGVGGQLDGGSNHAAEEEAFADDALDEFDSSGIKWRAVVCGFQLRSAGVCVGDVSDWGLGVMRWLGDAEFVVHAVDVSRDRDSEGAVLFVGTSVVDMEAEVLTTVPVDFEFVFSA